jgi:Family of unknown function (DUF695)
MPDSSEPTGRIVRTEKDGKSILWTYVPAMPSDEEQRSCPWLTVLRWHYDGSENNGMPNEEANLGMLAIDKAIGTFERPRYCTEAYRRVGDDLREFVLYVADRDDFLASLNKALADHPRYPIEIKFYEDNNWSDLEKLINDFKKI